MTPINPPWTRTAFPAFAGFLVTFILNYFGLNGWLADLGVFGITRTTIIVALASLIGIGYHTLAIRLGRRWPKVEKWMLGSSLVPVYVRESRHHELGATVGPMDPRTLDGTKYMDMSTLLAAIPPGSLIGRFRLFLNWLMLGNDTVGDCVIAGILHAIMWANFTIGKVVTFTTAFAVHIYSLWTGYTPADPNSDRGTDPDAAMKNLAKTGIVDANGDVHKIAAWFYVPVGNFAALRATIFLFTSAGICFNLPQSAQTQFPRRRWTVVDGSPIEGGHFVLAVDDDNKAWTKIVTWARIVRVARAFMLKFSSRWYGFVLEDQLEDGKDWHGFDMPQLLADVAAVKKIKAA